MAARKRVISEVKKSLSEEHELLNEQVVSEGSDETDEENPSPPVISPQFHHVCTPTSRALQTSQSTSQRRRGLTRVSSCRHRDAVVENDWTAAVKTSVDWKSLISPGLLPLTSDFCPSKKALDADYLEYNYRLFIDEEEDDGDERQNAEWGKQDR